MENVNLHKQRLIALAISALALIFLFLPWMSAEGPGGKATASGFSGWGLLSFLGILGVIVASLMGDKMKPYEGNTKMIAMGGFGLVVLGAIIYFLRVKSLGGQQTVGFFTAEVKTSAGVGLWVDLILGLAGLASVTGILDQAIKGATTHHPSTTPPPPPPPASTPKA